MGAQQAVDRPTLPGEVVDVSAELLLPAEAIWPTGAAAFGARHRLNATRFADWKRDCFKDNIYVMYFHYCFTPRKLEYYWDTPTPISRHVTCPAGATCNITATLPVEKQGIYSNRSDPRMVRFIINRLSRFLAINPCYVYAGTQDVGTVSFRGPATKVLVARVLNIKVSGEHHEYHVHGIFGDEISDSRFYIFPLVLDSLLLDSVVELRDV